MLIDERNRGFTLVEIMVALVLVILIFGVAASVVKSGQDSMGGSSLQGEINNRARELLNRIEEELISSGPSCPGFTVDTADPVVKVRYRKCDGYDYEKAVVKWDPPVGRPVMEIRLEDDDNKWAKPEWKMLTIGPQDADGSVIHRGMDMDLSFKIDPNDPKRLNVRLALSKEDVRVLEEGAPKVRDIEFTRTIFLRN